MADDIVLTVEQPQPTPLTYVEAAIKPETVGHVTPTYDPQTVYPAAGTVFGSVEVDAIPLPTEVLNIDENGEYDVARIGTARVTVAPPLEAQEVTPTKQTQTVSPSSGFYGLSAVEVKPIPPEYIIPSGTLDITENAEEIDVRDKAAVNVAVPIPAPPSGTLAISQNGVYNVSEYAEANVNVGMGQGVFFGDVAADGAPRTLTTYGYTALPDWFLNYVGNNAYNRSYVYNKINAINLNEGIISIGSNVFRNMVLVTQLVFPSTLQTLNGSYEFAGSNSLTLLDFSRCSAVVTLGTTAGIGIPSGCTIRVPAALLSEWQNATNWNALTDVVWEGV